MQKERYFFGCKVNKTNGFLLVSGLLFVAVAIITKLNSRYELYWNISDSLNSYFFIVDKHNKAPRRGDYIAFNYYDISISYFNNMEAHKYPKVTFVKKVVGVAGDTISQKNREFFVNNESVGVAKLKSRQGRPLKANEFKGVIPNGFYYVYTPHQDSYDSRYADVGLIPESEVKGVAYAF